jgi:hypothetical protein
MMLTLLLGTLAAATPAKQTPSKLTTSKVTQAEVDAVAGLKTLPKCQAPTVDLQQSFKLAAKGQPHDQALFLAGLCSDPGQTKLVLVEAKDGAVVQVLLDHPANQWSVDTIDAVAFKDVNGDGWLDLLVVASAMTGIGPTGAQAFGNVGVWLGDADGKWTADPKANEKLGALSKPTVKAAVEALKAVYRK